MPTARPHRQNLIFPFLGLLLVLTTIIGALFLILPQPDPAHDHQPKTPTTAFAGYSAAVTELVKNESPQPALKYIEEGIKNNQEMMKYCHPLVHLIGHLAYEKYGNFAQAIKYQNDVCGSGYLHGVIETKFAETDNVTVEMQTICNQVPEADQDFCFHGVGHGLMFYTENDLPQSIKLCQSYSSPNQQVRCAEGVYMENFSITKDSLHSSEYLNPEDPFYPCSTQPANLKNVCYYYSSIYYLSLHPSQYTQGLSHCLKAEPSFQYACAKGMGSRIMKENLTQIVANETMCNWATDSLQIACIEGLTSYHLVNYNSPQQTMKMCELLGEENKRICLEYLKKGNLELSK